MIILAYPTLGKSYITQNRNDVIDADFGLFRDGMLHQKWGDKLNPHLKDLYIAFLREAERHFKYVLCNWPDIGDVADYVLLPAYDVKELAARLAARGPSEYDAKLIKCFKESKAKNWEGEWSFNKSKIRFCSTVQSFLNKL